MAKDNIDVSNDLGSLLDELSKVRREEEKKKQEKLKEINQDTSFASMMAELSQVAKETKVIKKEEQEVTTKEEKVGLLSQLSQLAKETKKEESYEIGKDYADHTKEITPGQEKPKKKKARKRKSVDTVEHREPEKTEIKKQEKPVSPIIELTTKQISKNKSLKEQPELSDIDKLKNDFQKFKDIVTQQMGTIGGGGEVNLAKLDDVDTSSQQNNFALKYNSSTGKYDFGEVATDFSAVDEHILPAANNTYDLGSSSKRWRDIYLSSESIDLAGATISSDGTGTINIAATGATLPAGSKAGSNELAVISSSGDTLQAARVVPFFSASGGLSTKNTDFEFNATVDSRFTFTGTKTFTLSNGQALADSDPTLFQF